jgi:glutamate dehydrogenase (NAD(P)+)
MKQAFEEVYNTAKKHDVSWRIAAYIYAIDKVANVHKLRGVF